MVILVKVTSLKGDSIDLTLARESRISQLKREIEEHWDVPYSCQTLVKANCSTEALDSDKVDGNHYQMLIHLGSVGRDLETLPYRAIDELKRLGRRGGDDVLDLLCNFIRHQHVRDRRFKSDAIRIMADVTERGNPIAILALSESAKDGEGTCRYAAIEMLAKIAEKGNAVAIDAFCECLKTDDLESRGIAIEALLQIAEKGDQNAIVALSASLSEDRSMGWYNVEASRTKLRLLAQLVLQADPRILQGLAHCYECESLRDMAMWAIVHVATKSADTQDNNLARRISTEAVSPYLEHEDAAVKRIAEETLDELVVNDDFGIVSNLKRMPSHYRGRIFHQSHFVRIHALKALLGLRPEFQCGSIGIIDFTDEHVDESNRMEMSWLTGHGYQHSILTIVGHLEHKSPVRGIAASMLDGIARKGDEQAIFALLDCFDDRDDSFRMQIISSLNHIVFKGDAHVVGSLLTYLDGGNPLVRASAAKMLGEIASEYDEQVIRALCNHLVDDNDTVKLEVLSALLLVAEHGHRYTIERVTLLLQSGEPNIRRACARTLGELAQRGDEQSIVALCNQLHDVDENVRLETISSLFRISGGDKRAIVATCGLLHDVDVQVTAKAIEMLYKTAGFIALRTIVDNLDPVLRKQVSDMIEDMIEEEE